jgi:hypothetical protein
MVDKDRVADRQGFRFEPGDDDRGRGGSLGVSRDTIYGSCLFSVSGTREGRP